MKEGAMRRGFLLACLVVLLCPWGAAANQELLALQNDDGQWVLPSKNYSSTRYSTLGQINADDERLALVPAQCAGGEGPGARRRHHDVRALGVPEPHLRP